MQLVLIRWRCHLRARRRKALPASIKSERQCPALTVPTLQVLQCHKLALGIFVIRVQDEGVVRSELKLAGFAEAR